MADTSPPAETPTLFGRRHFRRLRELALAAQTRLPGPAQRTASNSGPLAFVICGVEHSGTTLVSELFRQVPGYGSGFETGILLADTPGDFAGVESHYKHFHESWWLTPDDVAAICAAPDFAEFYTRLAARAGVLKPGTTRIFDKTPRYLVALQQCLGRVSVPFIGTYKDPRSHVYSDWMRAGRPDLLPWLDSVLPEKLGYLMNLYQQYQLHRMERRVLFSSLESLCLRTGPTCEAMFTHVGLEFEPRYLIFPEVPFLNTAGHTIRAGMPFAYHHAWTTDQIRAVAERFAALDDWFYA